MLRYLKSAFFLRHRVPLLGQVPFNVLAVVCVGILGLAHPAIWLGGLGLELAYLFGLAGNRRFQKVVDAESRSGAGEALESKRRRLVTQLTPAHQARLGNLENRCRRVLDLYAAADADPLVLDSNREALFKLQWLYLKLLIAHDHLSAPQAPDDEADLRRQIAALEHELERGRLPEPLAASKSATRDLLAKRLEMIASREQSIREIEADLTRIDAQVDLALDQAVNRNKPLAITPNLDLAGRLLDAATLGDSVSGLVDELDEGYARPVPERIRAAPPRNRQIEG